MVKSSIAGQQGNATLLCVCSSHSLQTTIPKHDHLQAIGAPGSRLDLFALEGSQARVRSLVPSQTTPRSSFWPAVMNDSNVWTGKQMSMATQIW